MDVGPNGYEVCFLSDLPDRELLAVTFDADGTPIAETREGAPARRQRALAAAARTTAALPGPELRSIIVVPPADDAGAEVPIDAYVMRLAERPGDVPIGVHRRVWLSSDGRRVAGTAELSKSPLIVPGREGNPPADVTVTHLLGPTPSETHVYLSLKHQVPLSVSTTSNEEQWVVDGESISLL